MATTTEIPAGTADILDALRRHSRDDRLAGALDLTADRRQWRPVAAEDGIEVWLVSWPAGAGTGWHDHGAARGAFTTLRGRLTEYTWDGVVHARTLPTGSGRAFGAAHVHDVVNEGTAPALSLHAYAPRLLGLTRYELRRGRLDAVAVAGAGVL